MNQPLTAGAEAFLARYRGLRDRLPGDVGMRDAAAATFAKAGLPGRRNDAWHYTSLRPLEDTSFQEPLHEVSSTPVIGALPDMPRLVFMDGRYQPGLSTPPEGITLTTFADRPGFGAVGEAQPMVALNTMLAEDGVCIDVAAGVDAGGLVLLSLAPDGHRPIDFHPRHAIRLEAGAKLAVLEIARGEGTYLHNAVFEIAVAADAVLSHVRLQEEGAEAFHISTTLAHIAERGTYDAFVLTLGARLARSEVHATLAGPHGDGAPERRAVAGGASAWRHHDRGEARRAQLCVQPDHQERAGRAFAGRIPGPDRRCASGAEDRRLPDESGITAFAERGDRLQAAARDLCRRREVQPWRDGRGVGRGPDVLPP